MIDRSDAGLTIPTNNGCCRMTTVQKMLWRTRELIANLLSQRLQVDVLILDRLRYQM